MCVLTRSIATQKMRSAIVLLLALAAPSMALRVDAAVGRRAAILAAASSLTAPFLAPANAADVNGIISRAKGGELGTSKVITRALGNDMIDPKSLPDCATLTSVLDVDRRAANELQDIIFKIDKLAKAAGENLAVNDNAENKKVQEALKSSVDVARTANKRITQRVGMIESRYNAECVMY